MSAPINPELRQQVIAIYKRAYRKFVPARAFPTLASLEGHPPYPIVV